MKRYDIEDTGTPEESYYEMIENDDGEWVKWEDVKEALSESNCVITIDIKNYREEI